MAPLLVVVGGAPGAGKSALAGRLSEGLRLPLIAKDDVKQALYEALGAVDMESSHRLSGAAFAVLFAVASRLLEAGVGLVLEGNFGRGEHEAGLRPLVGSSRALQVHCSTTRERTLDRYSRRTRDEMHFDHDSLGRVTAAFDAGVYEPMELDVPVLRVDTTDGYEPPLREIVAFIRRGSTG